LKAALLVVDVQNDFFNISKVCSDSLKSAIEYVNAAIGLFREMGLPVVIVQHRNEKDGLVPGNLGFEVPDSVKVEPGDLRILKTYSNSFNKTGLAAKLTELGVDTVIITGFCAEECVLSTYMGAEDLDIKPIILRGSLASHTPGHIKFVEEITDAVTFGALKTLL